jgi:peptide/nickel transport system substrate-binding protein
MPTRRWNPRTVRLLVVIVALIFVISGASAVYVLTRPSQTACTLQSKDPIIFDQPETPDTLDPHVTFSTPGWGIVQQVYQSLVNYNGSSFTSFVPVLAKSWTVSPDGFNYTFMLRQDVKFSNGHQFNAYVLWFSLYRAIVMNQAGSFILQQNFWYPGLNYSSSETDTANATAWMIGNLNSFNFQSPLGPELAVMQANNNSFQVIDRFTIVLHMGYGYLGSVAYANLLPSIAGPIASAVDPEVVRANGGVTNDTNDWMSTHMVGTGPYVLQDYDPATGYLLKRDDTYWGRDASAKESWNNIIQPGQASIQVRFQKSALVAVQDITSGAVAGLSFAYVGPSYVETLKNAACVDVRLLDIVYGSTAGGWWIYMNQQTDPFTDIHVRKAVAHAINYEEIISKAFKGYGQRWMGPVPPGYEYANPAGLQPYKYDLALAMQEMNLSRWPLPAGYEPVINYMYINLGDWEQVALILKANLDKIGIRLRVVGLPNIDSLYTEQGRDANGNCISQTDFSGGPFPIGQEFYTSDYISPDDWTQNNALTDGSANGCMAGYSDATMDDLVIKAAGETNPTKLREYYTNMTKLMYDNYTVAWLVVPDQFQVVNRQLTGFVSNPMGAALPFVVVQNTMKGN